MYVLERVLEHLVVRRVEELALLQQAGRLRDDKTAQDKPNNPQTQGKVQEKARIGGGGGGGN